MEKVFNHEVTKGLLKGWFSENDKGLRGIYYWDLAGGGTSPSFGGKKCSFAAQNFLYVGHEGGKKISDTIEDGFGAHENHLAVLAQKLWERTLEPIDDHRKLAERALGAIFGFSIRSAWNVRGMSSLIALSEPARLKYLDDQLNVSARSFRHWNFVFFQDSPQPLTICDTPLFDLRVGSDRMPGERTETCVMPLGPRAAVVGFRSDRSATQTKSLGAAWTDTVDVNALDIEVQIAGAALSQGMAEAINNFNMHRARRWLVASDQQQLLTLSPMLQPEELHKRVLTDSVAVVAKGQVIARKTVGHQAVTWLEPDKSKRGGAGS